MAKVYQIGIQSVAAAAGAAYATIHTGAGEKARIREIWVSLNAATASSIGLIRPSNTPVATTSVLGLASDPADGAATVNADTAWSTAPTVGTSYLRRITLPATIGAGFVWTFPADAPLVIPVSSWLVLWNFGASAGSVLNTIVVWEE